MNLNESNFIVFAGCLFPEEPNAQSLVSKCRRKENMILIKLDVTNEKDIISARAILEAELERRNSKIISERDANENTDTNNMREIKLHALINNAGIGVMGEFEWGDFSKQIKRVLEINTVGPALVTRTFLPLIRDSRGRIININSQASRYFAPGMCPYSMSKAASLAMTESLRREMYKFGVKVISIEPFFYATEIVNRQLTIKKAEECWSDTDQSIKNAYGEKYYEKIMKMYDGVDSEGGVNNDPNDVALIVNHAVLSAYPGYNYTCASFGMRILLALGMLIPCQDLVEFLWKIMLHFSGFDRVYLDNNQDYGGVCPGNNQVDKKNV